MNLNSLIVIIYVDLELIILLKSDFLIHIIGLKNFRKIKVIIK